MGDGLSKETGARVRRRARALTSALVVVVGLVPATVTAAPLPRHASVSIDTSDVGDEGPIIKRRIQERTDVALRGEGVLPARPQTGDPIVHVDVDALDGPEPGYAFEMWVTSGQQPLGERRRVECTLCTETEIVTRVETDLLEHLQSMEFAADDETSPMPDGPAVEPAAVEPEPVAVEDPVVADPEGPVEDGRGRPRRLGRLGAAGVGLMAVGVTGLGVGAVLVALPPRVDPENPLFETTTRPPGFVALGVGAAALVSGVIMLAVDRRRARRAITRRGGSILRF